MISIKYEINVMLSVFKKHNLVSFRNDVEEFNAVLEQTFILFI